jgi:predicted Fe-Mo cluster-binding NifX family protein
MKLAIALFKGRISPRFDVCPEIWIVELKNGEVISQEKWPIESFNLQEKLDQLTSRRVDKVICGGIDSFCLDQLTNRGIAVIHNVAGEAVDTLNLFMRGVLQPGSYCGGKRGRSQFPPGRFGSD